MDHSYVRQIDLVGEERKMLYAMVKRTKRAITVVALARHAGVGQRTARDWLRGARATQAAKEKALEAAFQQLGGALLKQDGELGFMQTIMGLGGQASGGAP